MSDKYVYTPPDENELVIAIDLGTTTTSCAIYRDGSVESIEASTGQYTTPSVVAFTPDELLVGAAAIEQRNTANAENYLYGIKRLIGRNYNDPEIQEDLKLWPFKVIEDPNNPNRPLIQVEFLGQQRLFSPEEISAFILQHVRRELTVRLGREVKYCVITVPAYFTDAQRAATRNAGIIAGWHPCRVINEPTASAFYNAVRHIGHQLAYKIATFNRNLLIFDLGGGTYDVTIINLEHKDNKTKVTTLAGAGDSHFGGEDFDNAIIKHFYDMINTTVRKAENDPDWDLRKSNPGRLGQRRYAKLRQECVRAKEDLSIAHSTPINLVDIEPKCDLVIEFSRADFTKLIKPLVDRVLPPLESSLKEAGLTHKQIDDVVLVGGSSRIVAIKDALKKLFTEEQLKELFSEADVSVSRGASIVAASCSKHKQQQLTFAMDLIDITSHTLSRLAGGSLQVVVPKNTPIPYKNQFFLNKRAGPTSLSVVLYEGEHKKAKENVKLGTVRCQDLDADIENEFVATVNIDENGILSLELYDPVTKQKQYASFERGDLNDSDVLKKRAEFQQIDIVVKETKRCNERYETLLDSMKDYEDLIAKADMSKLQGEPLYKKFCTIQVEVNTTIVNKKKVIANIEKLLTQLEALDGLKELIKKHITEADPDGDEEEEFDFDF